MVQSTGAAVIQRLKDAVEEKVFHKYGPKEPQRQAAETLLNEAYEHGGNTGYSKKEIEDLVSIAIHSDVESKAACKLFKCAIPKASVSEDFVVSLLSKFRTLERPKNGLSLTQWDEKRSAKESGVQCRAVKFPDVDHSLQLHMLRWLFLVFPALDGRDKVNALYTIFFHYLDYETLCPQLCQILFVLTRREDVRRFRVRRLLSLREHFVRRSGGIGVAAKPISYIDLLLSIYKFFDPTVMVAVNQGSGGAIGNRRQKFGAPLLECTDRVWAERVEKVRAANADSSSLPLRHAQKRVISEPVLTSRKRARKPAASYLTSDELRDSTAVGAEKTVAGAAGKTPDGGTAENIPVEQITSIRELISVFERVDVSISSHALAVLLQNDMFLDWLRTHHVGPHPSPILSRVQSYLEFVLKNHLFSSTAEVSSMSLQILETMCERFDESPVNLLSFFRFAFGQWGGLLSGKVGSVSKLQCIVQLMKYIPLSPWEDLYEAVLKPLMWHFSGASVDGKSAILCACIAMLKRWMKVVESVAERTSSKKTPVPLYLWNPVHVQQVDYLRSLYEAIKYVDRMACVALAWHPNSVQLLHIFVELYELLSEGHTRHHMPFLVVPPIRLAYSALLAPTGDVCSRLCAVIVKYKEAFGTLKVWTSQLEDSSTPSSQQSSLSEPWKKAVDNIVMVFNGRMRVTFESGVQRIDLFNKYLLDFSNALVRCRLYAQPRPSQEEIESKTILFDTPIAMEDGLRGYFGGLHGTAGQVFQHLLSVTHSTAFSGFAFQFLKQITNSTEGPELEKLITQQRRGNVIWKRYKNEYIEFLERNGFTGLDSFLRTFIASMARGRQG